MTVYLVPRAPGLRLGRLTFLRGVHVPPLRIPIFFPLNHL